MLSIGWIVGLALADCYDGPTGTNIDGQVIGPDAPVFVEFLYDVGEVALQHEDGTTRHEDDPFAFIGQAVAVDHPPLAPGAWVLDTRAFDAAFDVDDTLNLPPPEPPEVVQAIRSRRGLDGVGGIDLVFEPIDDVLHIEVEIDDLEQGRTGVFLASDRSEFEVFIGDGGGCDETFGGYSADEEYTLRARSVGRDGQATAWTPVESAPLGCGCQGTPSPQGALWLLPLVVGIARSKERLRR